MTILLPALPKVPLDPLRDVFNTAVIAKWQASLSRASGILERIEVLQTCGTCPSDERMTMRLVFLRAQKAAWEAYLHAAFACGMFDGKTGNDLRRRLAQVGDKEFCAAMAECMTAWFLASRMRFQIHGAASGRAGKNLEMKLMHHGMELGVEVKAPFRSRPTPMPGRTIIEAGDDADKIQRCLEAANKQFSATGPNLLVIVPHLRFPMFGVREHYVKALFGEHKVVINVNTETGEGDKGQFVFFPEGRFLNPQLRGGKPVKRDGSPAFTRISAVLCIEELFPYGASEVEHDAMVLHNPNATHRIPPEMWPGITQLIQDGDGMIWTKN